MIIGFLIIKGLKTIETQKTSRLSKTQEDFAQSVLNIKKSIKPKKQLLKNCFKAIHNIDKKIGLKKIGF